MVKMGFVDPVLEKIVRRWKWARNNTILLFEMADKKQMFDFASRSVHPTKYTFQPLMFREAGIELPKRFSKAWALGD